MQYTHQVSVQWNSTRARDEFVMKVIKSLVPHLLADLFLEDEQAIGQNTATTVELVDALPANDRGDVPLGVTQVPIQMGMMKTRQLTVKIRVSQTLTEIIHTLAHELEHVRQSYTAELVCGYIDPETNINVWKGKAFSTRVIGYADWPWEVAANKFADDFMTRWEDCLESDTLCII